MGDRTIHYTLAKSPRKPKPYIYLWDGKQILVYRKSRREQLQCFHEWYGVAVRGHGKWITGCKLCGALSR